MNCCYECLDRHIGCHSKCKKYKQWRKKYDEEQKEIKRRKAKYIGYYE